VRSGWVYGGWLSELGNFSCDGMGWDGMDGWTCGGRWAMVLFGVGPIVSGWLGPGLLQRDFHVCMLSRGVCLSGWSEGRHVLVTGSRYGDRWKQSALSLLRTGLVCLLGQPFCLPCFYLSLLRCCVHYMSGQTQHFSANLGEVNQLELRSRR
jgi:hypothetical protein